MGKLILCTGKIAKEAYLFPFMNIPLYSIEELCYFLYENIYLLSEEHFQPELAVWMENELGMKETAEKTGKMIERKESLKNLVVTILCSADYYEEREIKGLIAEMDRLSRMRPVERDKIRADCYLKYGEYSRAAALYQDILNDREKEKLSDYFCGNIIHDLGITKMQMSTFDDAADAFCLAYELNKNKESLYSCLYCLKLAKKESRFRETAARYKVDSQSIEELENQIEAAMAKAEKCDWWSRLKNAEKLKEDGKIEKYYEKLDEMIQEWKESVKNGLV